MPVEVTYPGVYVEEIAAGIKTISGVPTSTAAFLGRAEKGPRHSAVRCRSFCEFLCIFGGGHSRSDLNDSVKHFFENAGNDCYIVRIGGNKSLTVADFTGDAKTRTGFYALDQADLFNLMIIPGDADIDEAEYRSIAAGASVYCKQKRAFLLLDAPASWTCGEAFIAGESDVNAFRDAVTDRQNTAVFYPRIKFRDDGNMKTTGASGMIAGVIARTDAERGVWKAPAGFDAVLSGASGVEVNLTDRENGSLNSLGVNCIRKFPRGVINWGARTLDGADTRGSDWKYIPIRRLLMYLEHSIDRGTQWAVFEPNDEPLWANIRSNVQAFMMNLFRQGAFQGNKPEHAFFVKCGRETTTQQDIDAGSLNIQIGFAPLKPAEFVIINIRQIAKRERKKKG